MQPTAAGNCSVRNEKMHRQMALNGQGDQGQTSIIGRDQANQGNLEAMEHTFGNTTLLTISRWNRKFNITTFVHNNRVIPNA